MFSFMYFNSQSYFYLSMGLIHTLFVGKVLDYMGWDYMAILFQVFFAICLHNIVVVALKLEGTQCEIFSFPDTKKDELQSYIYTLQLNETKSTKNQKN